MKTKTKKPKKVSVNVSVADVLARLDMLETEVFLDRGFSDETRKRVVLTESELKLLMDDYAKKMAENTMQQIDQDVKIKICENKLKNKWWQVWK